MEIEKRQGEIGKKLWNIVRIVLYMMKKSIGKSSKIMVELTMLLKRGKIATKAIGDLTAALHHHHRHYYAALTCRSDHDINTSFISPRHVEFSCTTTPLFHSTKRKNHHRHHGVGGAADDFKVMHKVFDILNRYDVMEASPLPGFGRSPAVRQLRVTDSPFGATTEENGGGHQVDLDAEEFIKKFYKDLKNQKRIAALESPSPYRMWAR